MNRTEAGAFIRALDVATAGLSAEAGAAMLRAAAAANAARVPREQSARSGGIEPALTRVVDGVRGASPAAIRADSTVLLDWNYLREACRVVVDDLRARAPRASGELARGVVVLVDGREADPDALPPGAQAATVVSTVPYARRIEVGRGLSVKGFGLFQERAAQLNRRLAGVARLSFRWVDLADAHVGSTLRRERDAARRAGNERLARSRDRAMARGRDAVRYPGIDVVELRA